MALIYFYDATELDQQQLGEKLRPTDHHWEFIADEISTDNLNPDTEVLSIFVSSTVTRQMIEKLPKLRLIACRSTGFNNVDMQAAAERDIAVVNVPTYGESTVAEYVFAMLLSLTRNLRHVFADKDMLPNKSLQGTDLVGKTMVVIGTGHIGMRVVDIALGFGMKVLTYDPYPKAELAAEKGFSYGELADILPQADVISLHVPYMPTTHHLLNKERLSQVKQGAILINTARGELIDNAALIDAIESGHLGGVALDVVEGEHLLSLDGAMEVLRSGTQPTKQFQQGVEIMALQRMPNVIISPHNAFNTVEAIQRINYTTAQNIIDFWYDKVPNLVKPPQKTTGKLILARHAESEWNATGQWTGITDVHLSEKGFHEAGLLGKAFKELNIPLSKAYCSQQIRTRETLESMLDASAQFDVAIERNGAINERDYGEYTGKNKWEVKELVGEEQFNRIRRGWDVPIPGGESLKQVYERVIPFYTNEMLPQLREGHNILLVGHGNGIRSLIKYLENISDKDVENLEMMFGEILVYDIDDEGHMKSKDSVKIDSPPPPA